ncbi:MAG: hypothetical protein ACTSW1_12925 [Candidatus Hodarchaeales archaeon]
MDKRLWQIANFKVRPGLKNYHYAALATVDENGRPYVRLRSPTVQRKVEDLRKDLDAMLQSGRSRLSPEEIKAIIDLDEKNKEIVNKREELILMMEEYGNPDHIKRTLKNLENHKQGVLVCLEAEIMMLPGKGPCNARITNGTDAIFDVELAEIYDAKHPYYQYRKARYMIQLASFHLSSFKPEDREKRFDESIKIMFTLKAKDIKDFTHRFEHPAVIPEDERLDSPIIAAEFINKNRCGVVAAIDHSTGNVTAIPAEAFCVPELGEGVFIEIDVTQASGKEMYDRIIENRSSGDPYISFTIPAIGMGAEIGLAYDGKVKIDEKMIEEAKRKFEPFEGTKIIYLDPQRITDVSTPQDRRGRIIYSHFKEIGWE